MACAAAAGILEQCATFVRTVDGTSYRTPSASVSGSSIGQHVRHALDHFAAALSALDDETIDYDHRERDTCVERDPGEALAVIARLRARIDGIDETEAGMSARVRVMLSSSGDEAELRSTLARELAFAAHHAIHHHALIGVIARELGLGLPEGFGKAPATLNHEARFGGGR